MRLGTGTGDHGRRPAGRTDVGRYDIPQKGHARTRTGTPRELYERLQALSNARRQTITQLCEELIARSLEHEEEKKEK